VVRRPCDPLGLGMEGIVLTVHHCIAISVQNPSDEQAAVHRILRCAPKFRLVVVQQVVPDPFISIIVRIPITVCAPESDHVKTMLFLVAIDVGVKVDPLRSIPAAILRGLVRFGTNVGNPACTRSKCAITGLVRLVRVRMVAIGCEGLLPSV